MNDTSFTPRRRGYFRIALPEKKYVTYNKDCPFTFEYPVYAQVFADTENSAEPCWLNIVFPRFKAKIYLSYKVINGNLNQYIEQSRMFAVKHEVKASAIDEHDYSDTATKVYGLVYDISGDAASNMQFYLTDSAKNFVRGALYFYSIPNKDSLYPVLNFIKLDIEQMVKTFRWKSSDIHPSIVN
jgi:gliding motility-associated lipoprotein GldD